ncbi:DMT family transporter [Phormidesmis priestleyi]|uniref:DMT family transporter n=1 Tax=Phormidesmis priestleyi TaxID=268141 RepID=UPI000839EBED|nr:EamA family transporter [Phormidesmis priestleyi]
MTKPENKTAIAALLVLAVLWGYNWVQMKIAVQYASPFVFAGLRIVLGAASLLLSLALLRKPIVPKEIPGTLLTGLLQISGMYGFATWALVSGGAGKTAVLVYVMPFWVLILAWLFLGERVKGMQWVAIAISVCGLLFILEPTNLNGTILSKVLALLSGLSWAGGVIVAKKLRQTVELDLLSFTAWQTVFGAIPLVLAAVLVPSTPIVWSTPFIIALIYAVIPGTAIATLLWLYVLNCLPAGIAGLGLLMNPVVGVLAAWAQLGEQPGFMEVIGMGLIAIALLLNTLQAMQSQT